MDERSVGASDVVFAIATGGSTPFVHGALRRARRRGVKTVFLACVAKDQITDDADVSIRVITGLEVVTGSTRMKTGTATKMVLNMVTTIARVQIGKVYQNLMVDVNTAANVKLLDHGMRMIQMITGLTREVSQSLLDAADGHVKTALVMHSRQVDRATAEDLLAEVGGDVGQVIESP